MGALSEGNVLKGRYEIIKIINDDMGQTLYLAKDKLKNNSSVFMRELDLKNRSGKVFTPEAISNLVDILSILSYRTIPKFVQVFAIGETYYIVEEFIEGSYLEELLQNRDTPFTFEEAYLWLIDMADTLHYLHGLEKSVIVRGISPATLKVTSNADIKLVDFSMARFYTENKDLDTLFVWNPGYTSPEQYGSQKSDVRSDIYSYGATFYRLFTMQEVGLMNFNFPPVSTFNASFTPAQDEFMRKCLSKDINERFQSAYALKKELMALSPFKSEGAKDENTGKEKGIVGIFKSIFKKK